MWSVNINIDYGLKAFFAMLMYLVLPFHNRYDNNRYLQHLINNEQSIFNQLISAHFALNIKTYFSNIISGTVH